jgi:hypothetical protein
MGTGTLRRLREPVPINLALTRTKRLGQFEIPDQEPRPLPRVQR